jgi:hypothetical protein
MTKADSHTLGHLLTIVETQAAQLAAVRAELSIQFTRMAQMQAELDALPHAQKRRRTAYARLPPLLTHSNGNGHTDH